MTTNDLWRVAVASLHWLIFLAIIAAMGAVIAVSVGRWLS